MSCKHAVLVCVVAGCAAEDAAVVINVEGRALSSVELAPPDSLTPSLQGAGSFRWHVAKSPENSDVAEPEGDDPFSSVFPDVRGSYLVERWFVFGLSEELTHRFVVTAYGAPPVASSTTATTMLAVNASATIDGNGSWSPEQRPLSHHWRLAMRPMESAAAIAPDSAQTTLIPDVAGEYLVELTVFDGELWSDEPSLLALVAQ